MTGTYAIISIAVNRSSNRRVGRNSDRRACAQRHIVRGRSEGRHYLEIRDDGEGVPRDAEGRPDFRYVATHICDSVKRRLKADGVVGLQGEFGIGLLSFWTLGEELTMISTADDQRPWQMVMRKGDPSYRVHAKRRAPSTAASSPCFEGIRGLSGEDPGIARNCASHPALMRIL
jgi:HSP90 family molecular chaperone